MTCLIFADNNFRFFSATSTWLHLCLVGFVLFAWEQQEEVFGDLLEPFFVFLGAIPSPVIEILPLLVPTE